jgi:spermidine/putrescine transport system ATP-binding protein
MTVSENVGFGLQMKKVDKTEIHTRVDKALEMVHLPGMGNRKPNQLSGGQQQRVALARALINRPKVLLLDEPLGALDLKLRKAMQLELKALQQVVGITFIYVTHDQEEALTMSDRIGVMNKGKMLQIGSAQEVYELPQSRFVADFIGESNYFEGAVSNLEDIYAEVTLEGGNTVWATAGHEIKVGEEVVVAVRPEKVSLLPARSENQKYGVSGTVSELVYLGSHTTYIVKLPTGTEVSVRSQNINILEGPLAQRGDQVALTWPKEASKAFSRRLDE